MNSTVGFSIIYFQIATKNFNFIFFFLDIMFFGFVCKLNELARNLNFIFAITNVIDIFWGTKVIHYL